MIKYRGNKMKDQNGNMVNIGSILVSKVKEKFFDQRFRLEKDENGHYVKMLTWPKGSDVPFSEFSQFSDPSKYYLEPSDIENDFVILNVN